MEMRELDALLATTGLEEIGSYINNGNPLFSSTGAKEGCISKVRVLLETEYDLLIPSALLTREGCLEGQNALS